MSELETAMSLARAARAIDAKSRDVPANAALVVLADEVNRLRAEKCLHAMMAVIARELIDNPSEATDTPEAPHWEGKQVFDDPNYQGGRGTPGGE